MSAREPCSYLTPSARVSVNPLDGRRTVVAREQIRMGDVVAIFGGRITTLRECLVRSDHAVMEYAGVRGGLQLEDDLLLVPRLAGPAEFIQHCCQPNCGFSGEATLIAMRRIQIGDPICFDFACSDALPHQTMDCHCGASDCRRQITGQDWMDRGLQRRLDGYFSGYLQRRVDGSEEHAILSGWLASFATLPKMVH